MKKIFLFTLALVFMTSVSVWAIGHVSTNYRLIIGIISTGGDEASSTYYNLSGVQGLPVVGETMSSDYKLDAGYWPVIESIRANGIELTQGGDLNGDDIIDITDALLVARCALNLSSCDATVADVDCRDGVTIIDALLVARRALGLPTPTWCK